MIRRALGVNVVAIALLAASIPPASGSPRQGELASPAKRRVSAVAMIEVGGSPSAIVAAAGAVWVSTGLAGIVRIDPATNEPVAAK
jgi:streptogramin lyase